MSVQRRVGVAVTALATLAVFGGGGVGASAAAPVPSWPSAGHDLGGSRNNPLERTLNSANVATLATRWADTFAGPLTSTPTVAAGLLFQPDTAGNLTAVDAHTGVVRWSHKISDYTGHAGDVDHASPAYSAGRLVFGVRPGHGGKGASIVAVRASTGALLWRTVVDKNPISKITGGVLIDGSVAYVGVSSSDEDTNPCGCTFRGSLVALNVATGAIRWRTYTVPLGYTGGAIFAGSPVADHATGLVYAGTGNNYSVPSGVCRQPTQKGCTTPPASDHFDSLLAFNPKTGKIVWALRARKADAATNSCRNTPVCGPDYGFAAAPNILRTKIAGKARVLVGAGEKSGIYWAADARTGRLVWERRVGPGGSEGGIEWGTAFDGTRIYAAVTNSFNLTYVLQPSGRTTTGGAFSALNPATGKIIWQTADPQRVGDFGYVSVANGVVYAGSSAVAGANMYALRASTGKIVWSFASGGAVMAGAAIVAGIVYWPAGYYTKTCPGGATPCTEAYTLYSFGLPRK